jgi:hypothetical protein
MKNEKSKMMKIVKTLPPKNKNQKNGKTNKHIRLTTDSE